MTRAHAWGLAAVTAAIFMALDQATKQLAIASVAPGEERNVFFGIDLTNVRNRGVAFGALEDGGPLIGVLTGVALTGLVGYFALRATTPALWLPIGVIVGGAVGNLADRARDGAVIDFVDPVLWPAFNLADAGIVIGILGVLYIVEKK